MAITTAPLTVGPVRLGTSMIGGITRSNVAMNPQTLTDLATGVLSNRMAYLSALKPTASFSTFNIDDLLAATSAAIIADIGGHANGLALQGTAFALGAARGGDGTNYSYTLNDGVLCISSLSVSHQQNAIAEVMGYPIYDGTDLPVIVTATDNVLASALDTKQFGLGGGSVAQTAAGITIDEIQSLKIDFNVDIESLGGDGDVYDSYVIAKSLKPVITIECSKSALAASGSIGLDGASATHANTVFWLRKRSQGGMYVANATTEHIKITACGVLHVVTPFDASANDKNTVTLQIDTNYDGTNQPVVFTADTAIA